MPLKILERTEIAVLVKNKFQMTYAEGLLFADYYSSKDRSSKTANQFFPVWDIKYFDCTCCEEDFNILCSDGNILSVGEIIDFLDSHGKSARNK